MCETHTHLLSLTVTHCHSLSLTHTHSHSRRPRAPSRAPPRCMFEVATPYETRFAFSRFDAAEQFSSLAMDSGRVEKGGAGDASAMD